MEESNTISTGEFCAKCDGVVPRNDGRKELVCCNNSKQQCLEVLYFHDACYIELVKETEQQTHKEITSITVASTSIQTFKCHKCKCIMKLQQVKQLDTSPSLFIFKCCGKPKLPPMFSPIMFKEADA